MNRYLIRQTVLVCMLMMGGHQAMAGPDAFIDLDVGFGLDDNLTRAQENIDIEHDVFVQGTASYGMPLMKMRQGVINGSAALGAQQFNEFDGLNNVSLRLGASYLFGFSGSFGAPWFAVDASYTLKEFDSLLRDSDIYSVGGQMGLQIDDQTSFRTGLNFKVRESEGVAFDTEDVSLFVNFDFTFPNSFMFQKDLTMYTTYKIQQGDVFSTASQATAFSSGSPVSLALASASIPNDPVDDVFGGIAYRLDATTHLVTIGFNLKVNLRSAYDVSVRVLQSDADIGLEYEDLALTFSYFHKFGIEF